MSTLRINPVGLAKIRRLTKTDLDWKFAEAIQVNPATVSRVLTGKAAPGPKFIAGCVEAFGGDCFADLFTVVPDDDAA